MKNKIKNERKSRNDRWHANRLRVHLKKLKKI